MTFTSDVASDMHSQYLALPITPQKITVERHYKPLPPKQKKQAAANKLADLQLRSAKTIQTQPNSESLQVSIYIHYTRYVLKIPIFQEEGITCSTKEIKEETETIQIEFFEFFTCNICTATSATKHSTSSITSTST